MKPPVPLIPPGLVEWLEDGPFRDAKLPTDLIDPRELDRRIGQRSVIEKLREEQRRQQEEIRNPHNSIRR